MKSLSKYFFSVTVIVSFSLATSGCYSFATDAGCDFGSATPPEVRSKAGVAVVFHGADDFPDAEQVIRQSSDVREALPTSQESVPFSWGLVAADGKPNLLIRSWVNLSMLDTEFDLKRKADNAQATMAAAYECAFDSESSFGDLEDNVNLLGGLQQAANLLSEVEGERLIVVISNGIQTSGTPDFSATFPSSFSEVDSIVSQLRDARALPDLKGARVAWIGLGQTTEDYEGLEQQAMNVLEYFWKELIVASGGLAPESFSAGSLGGAARENAPTSQSIAGFEGVCLFTLDEAAGFTFKPDSSEFVSLDLARAGAESIARQIFDADCGSRSLRVTGYTASGTSKSNFEKQDTSIDAILSKARAQAFASLLIELGLDVKEVVGGGKGPVLDWDENGEFVEELGKKNRIVLIEEIR